MEHYQIEKWKVNINCSDTLKASIIYLFKHLFVLACISWCTQQNRQSFWTLKTLLLLFSLAFKNDITTSLINILLVVNVSICLSPLYLLYCYQKTKPRPHKLLLKQVKFDIIEVKRVLFEIQFPFTVFLWFGSLNMLVPSDQLIKSNLISKFLTREQSMFSHLNISEKKLNCLQRMFVYSCFFFWC